MKELGELKHFLGLEVEKLKKGIFLYQQKYAKDLLETNGMFECKPLSTPMGLNVKLWAWEGKDLEDTRMYPQLVGILIYLSLTRPDLVYTIRVASCYMKSPKRPHLEAVRRILRYMKGTLYYGMMYRKGVECQVIGYYDDNYVGHYYKRRSTIGYHITGLMHQFYNWCNSLSSTIVLYCWSNFTFKYYI